MDKELIARKEEALEFWISLRRVIPLENKIKLLEEEIKAMREVKDGK